MADQSDWAVRLIDRVTGPAKKMKGAIGSLEKAFQSAGKGVRSKAADGFVTGISKIKEGMLLTGAIAGGVAVALVGASIKTADFAQKASAGFKVVAKDGISAEQLFSRVRGEAEQLGLDVMKTSESFLGFLQQGADPAMATNLVRSGADLQAMGKDAAQVESIFYNVNKILAQGKAQGDEFAPIFEAGINRAKLFEKMAERTGKTVDELNKQLSDRGLESEFVIPSIVESITELTGGKQAGDFALKNVEKSFSGMAGRMLAQAQNLWIGISREATPAFMTTFKAIQAEFGEVLGNRSMRDGIVSAVEAIAGFVREAIPFVKQFVGSLIDGFSSAFPAIQGAVGVLSGGFGDGASWMDNVSSFATTLGKVVAFGVGVAEVFGGMVAAGLQVTVGLVDVLTGMWEGLIAGIGAAIFWVDDFFSNLGAKWDALDFGQIAVNIIDGLVNGLKNGVSFVVDAVVNLGQSVMSAFESIFKIGSPSKVFEQYGNWSGEGYAIGLEDSFDGMGGQFDSLAKASAPDLGGIGGGSGGRSSMNVEITVNVGANDNGAALCREIGDALEERLGSIFERWTLATG